MIRPEDRPERPYTARRLANIAQRLESTFYVDQRVMMRTLARQLRQVGKQAAAVA
jgi:hypothetical protein